MFTLSVLHFQIIRNQARQFISRTKPPCIHVSGGEKTALKRGAREDARVNVRCKSINLCSRIVDTSDMLY